MAIENEVRKCTECGAHFSVPTRKRGLAKTYCSGKCKQRAFRRANPDRAAANAAKAIEVRRQKKLADPEPFIAYERSRYAANPEKYKAKTAAYRAIAENRERSRRLNIEWRKNNPGRASAASRAWEAAHPGKKAEYAARNYLKYKPVRNATSRAWYVKNKERAAALHRDWVRENRHLRAQHGASRRARKFNNGGSHTFKEWLAKCAEYHYTCAYCPAKDIKLTRDHVVPLSRGGRDSIDNIVPACQPCNSRKRDKLIEELTGRR